MARNLRKEDYAVAAKLLGVDPASVAAVASIEAGHRRRGFGSDGNVLILWERHICWRNATRAERSKLPRSVCNRKPGGYARSNAANWWRLNKARSVMGDRAYLCASYGLFQIMGFNHGPAGYSSAKEMADAFAIGEREQLMGFVRFIKSHPNMVRAIRTKDWAKFARLYNGKAYKRNRYDVKMAKAYKRFAALDWPDPDSEDVSVVAASFEPKVEEAVKIADKERLKKGVVAATGAAAAATYTFWDKINDWFEQVVAAISALFQ